MIVIAKFESCFCEIITRSIVIVIHEPAVKGQSIHSAKSVGIIIAEKIEFIFSPVKIETVLCLRSEVPSFIRMKDTCGGTDHDTSVEPVILSLFRFNVDDSGIT